MLKRDDRRRQEHVLEIIVRHYVGTAEPVGSRFVARRLGFSSATIRNVMQDLDDMGLIAQPYTSAGRVPTDEGYRYYIDSLMRIRSLNERIIKAINAEYRRMMKSLEDILDRTSHLISGLTNYIGLISSPQYEKIYLDGASHIIEQPEFKDFRKLYGLLRCLEEKRDILNLLIDDLGDDRLKIHIGKENRSSDLSNCSIVTRGYSVKGRLVGRLGVIGPTRMVYEKVIPTVEFLADAVSDLLSQLET